MDKSKEQVEDWLSKLERESWQLELLVSAFTIFLLIGAQSAYLEFLVDLQFQYDANSGILTVIYLFLALIRNALLALIISLVIHLMLRGFWIGAIGLRSVQPNIDYSKLNYSEFFTDKIKKKVITLDQLVTKLDVISSVIFAFSFLAISVLLAFGMYLLFVSVVGVALSSLNNILTGTLSSISLGFSLIVSFTILISGLIYMIDYFSLGFFKKLKWFSKVYYPFYQFYNIITLSTLSRSIYYYLISKFSKKKIRLVYLAAITLIMTFFLLDFNQHQYYPEASNPLMISNNFYDDDRPEDEYINSVSIQSSFIDKPNFRIFFRYDPVDNELIRNNCSDFSPSREEGLNWAFEIKGSATSFHIESLDYSDEEFQSMLDCQSSIYQVVVNDSIYSDLNYYFYEHPSKSQKGLIANVSTQNFKLGENILYVNKVKLDSADNESISDYARIPFWYKP